MYSLSTGATIEISNLAVKITSVVERYLSDAFEADSKDLGFS